MKKIFEQRNAYNVHVNRDKLIWKMFNFYAQYFFISLLIRK